MTIEEKTVVLERLSTNNDFLQAITNANSKDELQAVFDEFDLEMNREEIDAFVHMMNASVCDELNAEALDNVSGGVEAVTVLGWMWKGAKAVAKSAWNLGKKFADWESKL